MGFLTGLLTLPVAPMKATVAIGEQLHRQAAARLSDPARIKHELEGIDRMRRTGELSDAEADAHEDALLADLMDTPAPMGTGTEAV